MFMLPTLSTPFIILHIFCGITDVLDGYVARKTNTVSSFGSKLDTASDLIFYTVMMLKIWDILHANLPGYIWTIIYMILILRAIYYIVVGLIYKTLSSRHLILNKIVGALMFGLPFVLNTKYLLYYSFLILIIAYISLTLEIIYTIKNKSLK